MLMHVSGSGYHALRLLAATPGMDGDTLRAVICSGAFSALCSWAAPVQRCHCECYSSVPGQLLDILDRQLERCGPADLTSTRVVERCSDWSPFVAGFALGALATGVLGLSLVVAVCARGASATLRQHQSHGSWPPRRPPASKPSCWQSRLTRWPLRRLRCAVERREASAAERDGDTVARHPVEAVPHRLFRRRQRVPLAYACAVLPESGQRRLLGRLHA